MFLAEYDMLRKRYRATIIPVLKQTGTNNTGHGILELNLVAQDLLPDTGVGPPSLEDEG